MEIKPKTADDMQRMGMGIALAFMNEKYTPQEAMAVLFQLACTFAKAEPISEEALVGRFLEMVNATRDQAIPTFSSSKQ
jgi:hypothetical protein